MILNKFIHKLFDLLFDWNVGRAVRIGLFEELFTYAAARTGPFRIKIFKWNWLIFDIFFG